MTPFRSFLLALVGWGAAVGCGDPASPAAPPEGAAGAGGSAPVAGTGSQGAPGGATTSAGAGSESGTSGAGAVGGGGSGGGSAGASVGGGAAAGASAGGGAGAPGGGAGAAAGTTGGGSGGGAPLVAVTVYLAGDSTVSSYADTASPSDQAGWGQMLKEYLNPLAQVQNRAIGGRTARRFIEEGRLQELSEDLRAGDYLLVQFGTNDGNKTATYTLDGQTIPYYLDPATDFKTYLKQYIDAARAKQASPVLVTPPPRNSAYCTGGNGTGAHAQAMRELGAAEQVPVSDLNQRAVEHLLAICPAPTPEDFFLRRADGSVDGTHFQENGARTLARFVTEGLKDTSSPLARYVE